MKRLLVALDGSPLAEAVLPYAEDLARAAPARITLVRVVPAASPGEALSEENPRLLPFMVAMPTQPSPASAEAERDERSEAERYLDGIAKRLGERGVVAEVVVASGQPASSIVDEANLRQADLILMTTHGRSGLGRWIYGSVAEAVVAHSRVPVFLARAWKVERTLRPIGARARLVVPLDGSPEAERALPVATELARLLPADLHLVEIVPTLSAVALSETGWLHDTPRDLELEGERAATSYLDQVAERLRAEGIAVTTGVRVDSIGAGIVAASALSGAALVVMATHAPGGIARALVGSVAQEVLHRGSLPVLLVGPAAAEASTPAT